MPRPLRTKLAPRAARLLVATLALVLVAAAPAGAGWLDNQFSPPNVLVDPHLLVGPIGFEAEALVAVSRTNGGGYALKQGINGGYVYDHVVTNANMPTPFPIPGSQAAVLSSWQTPTGNIWNVLFTSEQDCARYFPNPDGATPSSACADSKTHLKRGPIAVGELTTQDNVNGQWNFQYGTTGRRQSYGPEIVRASVCEHATSCAWTLHDQPSDVSRMSSKTGLYMEGDDVITANEGNFHEPPLEIFDGSWEDAEGAKGIGPGLTQVLELADVDGDGDKDIIAFGKRFQEAADPTTGNGGLYGFDVWLNKPELVKPREDLPDDPTSRVTKGVGQFHKMPFVQTGSDMGRLRDGLLQNLHATAQGPDIVVLSENGFEVYQLKTISSVLTWVRQATVKETESPGAGGGEANGPDQIIAAGLTDSGLYDIAVVNRTKRRIGIFKNTTVVTETGKVTFEEGDSGEVEAEFVAMPREVGPHYFDRGYANVGTGKTFPGYPGRAVVVKQVNHLSDVRPDFIYYDDNAAIGARFHTLLRTEAPGLTAKPTSAPQGAEVSGGPVYKVVANRDIEFTAAITGSDIDTRVPSYRWKFAGEQYSAPANPARPLAPTITQAPANAAPGAVVKFSAVATHHGGTGPYFYSWKINGETGPPPENGVPSSPYSNASTLTTTAPVAGGPGKVITVTVTDLTTGESALDATSVSGSSGGGGTPAPAVKVRFGYTGSFLRAGEQSDFNAQATPPGTYRYEWDFNADGVTDKTEVGFATARHTFATAGAHPVSVKATDLSGDGLSDTSVRTVDVFAAETEEPDLAPRAHIEMSPERVVGTENVTFDADSSKAYPGGFSDIEWTFDEGTAQELHRNGSTVQHSFPQLGRHTVKLRMYDQQGRSDTDEVVFATGDGPGVLLVPSNPSPAAGESVTFSTAIAGGAAPFAHRFDLDNDPATGPGGFEAASETSSASRSFDGGTHTVRVQVTDGGGRVTTASTQVRAPGTKATTTRRFASGGTTAERPASVEVTTATGDVTEYDFRYQVLPPLSAVIQTLPDPPEPDLGETVTFTAATTGGLPNDPDIIYEWKIDGQVAPEKTRTLTRAFTTPKRREIDLKVTDSSGFVYDSVPEKSVKWADPITPRMTAGRAPGTTITPVVGEPIHISAAQTTGGIPALRYAFDLDDNGSFEASNGGSPEIDVPPGTAQFQTPGQKTVRVQVTDSDAAPGSPVVAVGELAITILKPLATALRPASRGRALPGVPFEVDAKTDTEGGELPYTFAWTVDDAAATDDSPDGKLSLTFPMPAAWHDVRVVVTDAQGRTASSPTTQIRAAAPVVPVIKATPARPDARENVVLSAAETTGGIRPLTYEWDLDDNGTYEVRPGEEAVLPARTFRASGDHPIRVRIVEFQPVGRDVEPDTISDPFILKVYDPLAPAIGQSPAVARPGKPVTFNALSVDPGGLGPYTYKWFVDNRLQAGESGSTFTPTFATPARRTVRVEIIDVRGYEASDELEFKVADELVAGFVTDNQSPQAGETLNFDARSALPDAPKTAGGIPPYETYDWDLDGDGEADEAAGHGPQASWTYDSDQTLTATLTVTDSDGVSDSYQQAIGIGQELQARFLLTPEQPAVGEQVTFSGQPSGGGKTPYTYAWFLDGSDTASGTGVTFQKTFEQAGRHTIELRVTDAQDRVSTAEAQSFKVADPIEATLSADPATPDRGESTTFTAAVTGGLAPLSYRFDLDGDEATGPGGFEIDSAGVASASRSFPTAGTRTVRVKVTDDDDVSTIGRVDVRVANPLTAAVTLSPAKPRPGGEVTLSAANSTGGDGTLTYSWVFDDGFEPDPPYTTAVIKRTYEDAGIHHATVTVTDARGRTSSAKKDFRVGDVLAATLSAAPSRPQIGEDVTFTAKPTGGIGPFEYAFDLDGDGEFSDYGVSSSDTATYATAGDRRPAARIRDVTGDAATVSIPLTVTPELIAVVTYRPEQPSPGQTATFDASTSTGGTLPRTYEWDGDGDGTYETDSGRTATFRRSFATRGDYKVGLRVTDGAGHVAAKVTELFVGAKPKATLTPSTDNPEVNEPVELTAGATPEGTYTYRFDTDGKPGYDTEKSESPKTVFTPGVAGRLVVAVEATDERGQKAVTQAAVTVADVLVARFAISPNRTVQPGEELALNAESTTGGTGPFEHRWDLNGDGIYERKTSTNPTTTAKVPTDGEHKLGLEVRDSAGRVRTAVNTVTAKTPSVLDDDCTKEVHAGLALVKIKGCFSTGGTQTEPEYTTKDDFTLNGFPVVLDGNASMTISMPTKKNPGGRLKIVSGKATLLGQTLFDGGYDWKLPTPGKDDTKASEGQIAGGGFSVTDAFKVFDFKVEGAIRLVLGRDEGTDSDHYVRLRMDVNLAGFKIAPGADAPGATARMSLRYDDNGLKAEAVFVRLQEAYAVGVMFKDVCLSYRAAGYIEDDADDFIPGAPADAKDADETLNQIGGCEMFEDNAGDEFLTCNVDNTVDNWNGTLEAEFPFADNRGFAAAVGLGGGKLSSFAFKANLGIQILPQISLESIAAGVCLRPPPLQVRGEVVIGVIDIPVIGPLLEIGGGFHYIESFKEHPWKFTLKGSLRLLQYPVGKMEVSYNGKGTVNVSGSLGIKIPPKGGQLISLEGKLSGFLETKKKPFRFNAEGSFYFCLVSVVCTGAELLVSSKGLSACVTIIDLPGSRFDIEAGFGANWGGAPKIMGPSCDVGPWRVTADASRSIARAAAAGPRASASQRTGSFEVGKGERVYFLRIRGSEKAPKVKIIGPDGTVIESSPTAEGVDGKGKFWLVEDYMAKATMVMIVAPAAGEWKVDPLGTEPIVAVESAEPIQKMAVEASVKSAGGRQRVVEYAYTPQPDTTLAFYEIDPKDKTTMRTLGTATPGACAKPRESEGRKLSCGTIAFEPTFGDRGERDIVAHIERNGLPIASHDVAKYLAPAPANLGMVRGLKVVRGKKGLVIVHKGNPGAVRYDVSAVVDDGFRELRSQVNARTARFRSVPRNVGVTVRVIGFDELDAVGPTRLMRLKPGALRAPALKVKKKRKASAR